MGRLKRKRPVSAKKKGRKKGSKGDIRQQSTDNKPVSAEVIEEKEPAPPPEPVVMPKREPPKPVKPSGLGIKLNFWTRAIQFLREVKVELKKVTWPSRKEAAASTAVVIILVIIVSAFLGLVDAGLSGLIRFLLK